MGMFRSRMYCWLTVVPSEEPTPGACLFRWSQVEAHLHLLARL
jgi:hypothetical protein